MAYQLKYYYSFKSLNGQAYTVNILEDSANVIIAAEIKGHNNPFTVEYDNKQKFDPVRGSGGTLNLLSETDQQFSGLYTADMMQYMVKLYKGSALVWCGFLNSELFSEPFDEIDNYLVSITANDGFNLLERLNYANDDGTVYTGMQSQWTVITNILRKLGLPYNNIFVSISTTIDGVTLAANETIFHKTYVNAANYLNEDGESEACRKVLEAILMPYGAFIIQVNGNIYISDLNQLAQNTTISCKKYNASTYAYISTDTMNQNIGDLTTLGWAGTGQRKDVIPGINEQIVRYSPYRGTSIIDFEADEAEFGTLLSSQVFGSTSYQWQEDYYGYSEHWTKNAAGLGKFVKMKGLTISNSKTKEQYLLIGKHATYTGAEDHLSFTYKKTLPPLMPGRYLLKVVMQAYFRSKNDLLNVNENEVDVRNSFIACKLRVGSRQWYDDKVGVGLQLNQDDINGPYTEGWWVDDALGSGFTINFVNCSAGTGNPYYGGVLMNMSDAWMSSTRNMVVYETGKTLLVEYIIPLYEVKYNQGIPAGGDLEFKIYDWGVQGDTGSDDVALRASMKDVRIKSLKIDLVDEYGNEIDKQDTEYQAKDSLNPKYKNKGEDIILLHGTNINDLCVERAGLATINGSDYNFIHSWTREGKSDIIENLLLRSVVSNYKNPSIQLQGTVNLPSTVLGYITYNNFLPGKKLMISGGIINFSEEEAELTLVEFNKDNQSI